MAYAVTNHTEVGLSKVVLDEYSPATWTYKSLGNAAQLIKLSANSKEYRDVLNKIKATMPTISVSRIERVQNPYLWGAYLLKKAEKSTLREIKLFHATAQSNVTSIVSNNYDWRRTVRSKFGKGVSFSPSAAYADTYCNKMAGTYRAMILNRVLIGRTLSGSEFTEIAAPGYDTTTGNTGQVYVKYGDNEFYPEYVAYYASSSSSGTRGCSNYNHVQIDHRDMYDDDDYQIDHRDMYDDDYQIDHRDMYDDDDYQIDHRDMYDDDQGNYLDYDWS